MSIESFDAVIIGSGAGGAPIAHELVKAGKRVLVLEKGPKFQPQSLSKSKVSDFRRDELYATGPEKRISHPLDNQGEAYYSSHVEPDINDEPHVYRHTKPDGTEVDRATIEGYTAQVVGGGTQLYGAVSLRYPELDFQLKSFNDGANYTLASDPNGDVRREARDWPISYEELEAYYAKAEELVGINGTSQNQEKAFTSGDRYQTPLDPNPISEFAKSGMEKMGMKWYRTPLAVITEDHAPSNRKAGSPKTGYVNRYGDPMGFKSNTWVSLLAPIQDLDNFEIRCNANVVQLESEGRKITQVKYIDASGRTRAVAGDIVVVACSAIESVRLLMLSGQNDPGGFGSLLTQNGQNDLLGKYFLTHCFGGAEGRVPDRFDKSISLDSDYATDFASSTAFLEENRLWAGAAIYNNTSDQALPISLARTHASQDLDTIWRGFNQNWGESGDMPGVGEELEGWIQRNYGNRLSVSFMANQVPLKDNRIELHPFIKDKWGRPSAYIIKEWHAHDRYLMDVVSNVCREILVQGGADPGTIGAGGVYLAENSRARIANHILGGARFGSDRTDSVLDPNCRLWDADNLYVTDGCFMPTSGGANPTLTIQANSFRIADFLINNAF
ncbi:GMC family oxidoreductase [Pontibacter sp. G13]|uniref:GMC family oxidoreductase n=1 Tax=Pontibacter sp. G13 TaxID=3074898 RepID=UPI00288AEAF3|nr:GMC family oxidoreductase [Pontibacter sp. G13]WNJ19482.1 GMC family oxidoreductase [Pontibacter sp. G13]